MAKPQSFKKNDPRINRNGAPKKEWTMTEQYKRALEEENETGVPRHTIVAKKLVQLAERGDVIAIKELGNRIDGMPNQSISGPDNGPIKIEVTPQLNKIYGEDK